MRRLVGPGVGRRRTLVLPLLVVGALVVAALRVGPGLVAPDCTLEVRGEQVDLTRAQARDATTLAAVTRRDGRTQQQLAQVLPAALGDAGGDLTPAAAARRVAGARGPVDPEVLSLGRALLGYGEDRLSCRASQAGVERQAEGRSGLTPRAAVARDALLEAHGRVPLGGFAPGGVRDGHVEGSAHYEGRAVDAFYRPVTARNQQRGWTAAQWLVAHAEELELDVVIFDRRLWSVRRSGEGWRPYRHPSGNTTNPVLAHEDHVHLDVLRGDA